MKQTLCTLLSACLTLSAMAQQPTEESAGNRPNGAAFYKPEISGTIRAKHEWQTETGKARFQVHTARVAIEGKVLPTVGYKAEIDLSDKGKIRMLDAYAGFNPNERWGLKIGQMRVPFTIDAHRSPHEQYFPNRSFIAKQVGDVRDVGLSGLYKPNTPFPIVLEAGIFNGSGLTHQNNFWTNNINFSAKAQLFFPGGINLTLSVQKIRPDATNIMMYDAGAYWERGRLHIEAEYLHKRYANKAFDAVNAVNLFAVYDIPVRHKILEKLSPLVRFDYMDDHSDGFRYLDGKQNTAGKLIANDGQRSRLTAGITLHLGLLHASELRINYEKYFYKDLMSALPSERDKTVVELMVHF